MRDLRKSYGRHVVLDELNLTIESGELLAVLGPSGSGKTTLLRVIAGFERAEGGSVTIGGRVVDSAAQYVSPEHRGIGYVSQEGSLFPHLTVAKNVGFGLRRGQWGKQNGLRKQKVDDLLEMVGLAGMGRRYPHQLSGGQQQRVALARALAITPAVVLLDEPFTSLDASLRAQVRSEVRDVLRRAGITAVLVTHDQDEALSWADRVAVIRHGRIGQMAAPEDLYARPADPGLAAFVGEANLLAGELGENEVGENQVLTALGTLPVRARSNDASGDHASPNDASGDHSAEGENPTDHRTVVLIRPEQIELSEEAAAGGLGGEVVDYQYFGHDAVIRVRPDDGRGGATDGALLVVRSTGDRPWTPGTRVCLRASGPVVVWAAPEPAARERRSEEAQGTGPK